MGLKDVLEKMKLVESDEPAPVRVPTSLPPPRPHSASPPPPPQMKDVLKGVAAKPHVDEAALSKVAPETESTHWPAMNSWNVGTLPGRAAAAFSRLCVMSGG